MSELSRKDIARRWGVTPQAVSLASAKDDFPEPTRTRHGKRWSLDDIKVWETKCRYRLPELFTLSDIAVWFDAHWPMGERPVVRVAYLIQAHRVRPSALHNGERLYSRQAVETLWGLLTEVRPSEARFESEDVAFHEYLQTGVPATADCAADPYWMVGHQANGNTGGIIAEEMEIPELPERPAPSEDEGEDNE